MEAHTALLCACGPSGLLLLAWGGWTAAPDHVWELGISLLARWVLTKNRKKIVNFFKTTLKNGKRTLSHLVQMVPAGNFCWHGEVGGCSSRLYLGAGIFTVDMERVKVLIERK